MSRERRVRAEKSRRVLIVVENLPVPFDRRVWNEANALTRAGYEVSIICPKGKDAEASYEMLNGISVYRHPLPFEARGAFGYILEYSSALFWEFYLSLKVAFGRGFDVIQACNPPDLIFLVAAPYKLFGKKFVFDHHDLNPELYEAKFGKRDLFYKLLRLTEKLTFKLADQTIATNESYRRIAIERGGKAPDKVAVVRSGPSLERMKVMPAVPEQRHGKSYLVGYVGVMGAQEGIQYLLRAAEYIVYTLGRTDIHFTLIGGGPELQTLQSLAADLRLDGFVTFTGRASDQELLEVLNTADVCVNPDECNEMNDKSTMNKIMEYMALGKPIVQFDLAEGRYSAGDSSLYAAWNDHVDFAQKIIELIQDPEKRRNMGEFGRERVLNQLSWDHEEPKLVQFYEQLFQYKVAGQ